LKRTAGSLKTQIKRRTRKKLKCRQEYDGDFGQIISTGSTLLDLAISGGRVHGGGIPGGILIEIFGKSGSGKTVMLCEIAGNVQRAGGDVKFNDPEGRLDKQFAKIFDFKVREKDYSRPDKVPEVFKAVRNWKPENPKVINALCADSLAALSTGLEMDNEDGDKMGMRRAKEFSEETRKTCRIIANSNLLMVCSNQIRQTGASFGEKYKSPGGEAIPFYASLRLKTERIKKLTDKKKIKGQEHKRVYGIQTEVEVYKSSIWKPYRTALIYIVFDYGIDDIRANLQFVKQCTSATQYTLDGNKELGTSMNVAIKRIEDDQLEKTLKENVIRLWEEIEQQFKIQRKRKRR